MIYSHNPITLEKISCVFLHKTCFEHFSTIIHPGDRIAILGPNGSGKTTLLKILAGIMDPTGGSIAGLDFSRVGYLPQHQEFERKLTVWEIATELITQTMHSPPAEEATNTASLHHIERLISLAGFASRKDYLISTLSGGERVRLGLVRIMATDPAIILLDEPTNHLDTKNRSELMELLHRWQGTAIIVTHDTELLRSWPTKLWCINNGAITVSQGGYDDFLQEQEWERKRSQSQAEKLKSEQKRLKQTEAKHTKQSAQGKRNAKNAVLKGRISRLEYSGMKENAEQSSGALRRSIENRKESINEQLGSIYITEIVKPKFDLPPLTHKNAALFIREGSIRYGEKKVLSDLYITIQPGDRIALMGENGSGKSTLFKAIMNDQTLTKTGSWHIPPPSLIGYIDQHYSLLDANLSVSDMIKSIQPSWDNHTIRKLLNDFLFRTPEEVTAGVSVLSGGERARLSLACIVAQAPSILLLDEITNNLDLIARQQITQALTAYTGTLLVISHDSEFLYSIGITTVLTVADGTLT